MLDAVKTIMRKLNDIRDELAHDGRYGECVNLERIIDSADGVVCDSGTLNDVVNDIRGTTDVLIRLGEDIKQDTVNHVYRALESSK